jgi:hypothetical protein
MADETNANPTPAETVAAVTSTEPNVANLTDDQLVEFKLGGETVRKPWAEVRQTQAMLPGDYTRKQQALADDRRRFADEQASFQTQREQVEAARAQLAQIVQDPNKLASLYLATVASQQSKQNQGGNQQFQPQFDPAAMKAEMQHEFNQQLQAFQTQQAAQKIEADLGNYSSGLLKSHPTLAAIDGIEEAVFSKVSRMNPSSVDEAKEYAKLIVDQMAEKQNSVYAEQAKAKAADRAKLSGIEPKGGHIVTAKKRQYGDIDDPKRAEDMIAFMQQMLNGDE